MRTRQRLGAVVALFGLAVLGACSDDGSADPERSRNAGPDQAASSEQPTGATPGEPETSGFPNLLAPSEEIRIGRHRYVSACQLLPLDAVRAVLGEVRTADDGIYETSWDRSPQRARNGLAWTEDDAECTWRNGLRDTRSVTIRLKQAAGADATEQRAIYDRLPYDVVDAWRRWKKVPSTAPAAALAFQEQLRTGVSTYRELAKEFGLSGPDPDGIVVPTETGLGGTFVFAGNEGNVTWQLEADGWPGQGERASDPTFLAAGGALVAALRGRLQDPDLDQSPAPTILGERDLLGNTPLLEPCALFDRTAFRRGTGLSQNGRTERSIAPSRPDLPDELGRRDPAAGCDRLYEADRGPKRGGNALHRSLGSSGSLRLDVRLVYLPTEEQAKQFYRGVDPGPKLRTDADAAHLWTSSGTIVARVGNYGVFFGTQALVSCDSPRLAGKPCDQVEDLPVDRAIAVRAFNATVKNLRAQAAERAPSF